MHTAARHANSFPLPGAACPFLRRTGRGAGRTAVSWGSCSGRPTRSEGVSRLTIVPFSSVAGRPAGRPAAMIHSEPTYHVSIGETSTT